MEYAWVPVRLPDPEGIVVCLEIREDPFKWTIIQIGDVRFDEELNLSYDWRLIHPGDCDISDLNWDNPELTKYLEKVIWDRIQSLANSRENQNGEGLDVPEQSPFSLT